MTKRKYQFKYTASIPNDPPFRPKVTKGEALADDLNDLWQQSVEAVTTSLGFAGDANLRLGLLLNMINRWPESMRAAMISGIARGIGMTLERDGDGMDVVVDMSPKFDSLSLEGQRQRPSGLIVPGE